jgi:hypothetical protein
LRSIAAACLADNHVKKVVIFGSLPNFPALTPTRHHDLRTWSSGRGTESANEVAKIESATTIR